MRLHAVAWPPPAEPKATVLIGPGRTEPIAKYHEAAGDLVARGFCVHGLDWRGQGLSARSVGHPQKGHVDDIAEYAWDLAAVLADIATDAPPVRPLLVLAHSTGGLATLHHLVDGSRQGRSPAPPIDGAVFSAPLLGLAGGPLVAWIGRLALLAVRLGLARRYMPIHGDWQSDRDRFETNRVTRDRRRFDAAHRLFVEHPELRVGGPTWGWLAAAFGGCAHLATPGVAERIAVPTLFAVAGADRVVDPAATRRVAARVPGATVLALPDSEHEILQEIDAVRDRFLDAFDAFADRLIADRTA